MTKPMLSPRTGMTGCHARSRSKLEIQAWVARPLQQLIWFGMLPHLSAKRWTACRCLLKASLESDMPMSTNTYHDEDRYRVPRHV